ncbi:PREDICTED: acetylcholine receptor subunit alpha-type deg-3-like [Priapulus caudatus]|uniref:Acetylcholine receptor subunit alpha-type deg-3-like n=1 Tax=Priapulus caudatus TaxID=37621 RepID=A0ABM1DV77_PRICU|nr:PREDICTED: acetylcholine receptor subunit alpha-type deg-3-like [Priapulus caudatus]
MVMPPRRHVVFSVKDVDDPPTNRVIVTHTGQVRYLTYAIYESSCNLDVRYFPFDAQRCELLFTSWSLTVSYLDLQPEPDTAAGVGYFVAHEQWQLVAFEVRREEHSYVCCQRPFAELYYTLRLRRKPLFYLFNIVAPSSVIVVIATVGFFTPSTNEGERKEKVSIGIVTSLSMTMLLVAMSETLPPTSRVVPLLVAYFGLLILLTSVATLVTVLVMGIDARCYRRHPFPRCLRPLLSLLAAVTFVDVSHADGDHADNADKVTSPVGGSTGAKVGDVRRRQKQGRG